jgi:hypothetical protein
MGCGSDASRRRWLTNVVPVPKQQAPLTAQSRRSKRPCVPTGQIAMESAPTATSSTEGSALPIRSRGAGISRSDVGIHVTWVRGALSRLVGCVVLSGVDDRLENSVSPSGLVPLFLAAHGASASQGGSSRALSRRLRHEPDRHRSLVRHGRAQAADRRGYVRQAAALGLLAASGGTVATAAAAAVLLGAGTALVYRR